MEQATTVIQSGIVKIVTLIIAAGICMVGAGLTGFVLPKAGFDR